MSNFRAVATVTATLAIEILQAAAAAAVPGAIVTTQRPDSVSGGGAPASRVNLYLYQVTPNAAFRNTDLPTRGSDGQIVERPRVALDLYYLLTFYGDEAQLEPQRLLGSVALAMHAKPMLSRQMIRSTVGNTSFPFLAASNLADEIELVRFTPINLSLEELSKLWAVFFQTQYALSVAYQATVVLIEGDESPQRALPVLQREFSAVTFRHATIERIRAQGGADQPIVAGSIVVIEGRQLRGEVTQLRIGGSDLMTLPNAGDTEIVFPLASLTPAGSLRAGVQALQIVQPMMIGQPPVPHAGIESNVAPLVVRPTITAPIQASATEVTLSVDPVIGSTQRVMLLLNEISNNAPRAYTFIAGPRTDDTNSITIAISGVKPADYLVRLQIDGAESLLDLNPASPNFGPKVTIA
jgi:hypothetical protein